MQTLESVVARRVGHSNGGALANKAQNRFGQQTIQFLALCSALTHTHTRTRTHAHAQTRLY